ncbi:MAG: hypothetical protein QOF60_2415 [Actinomycetota bacterium]|jgi:hypothetical protein|nr:hypothetical protein [Actinomycetota bacterium]
MSGPSLSELSSLLFREREVLGQLVDLLHGSGDPDEADGLLRSVSSLELHRAITAREAAVDLGLDGEPTLGALAAVAPPEWATLLDDHRIALVALTEEAHKRLRSAAISAATPEGSGNVVALDDARGPGVQRSLTDFLR